MIEREAVFFPDRPLERGLILEPGIRAIDRAWNNLTESKQRQFLQQIYDAKTDATRTK